MPVTHTKKRNVRYLTLWLGLLLTHTAVLANEQPRVLSSIRPLALLVENLAGDLVMSEVLLSGGESPHHLALKMSQIEKIKRADLVLWVGPELESFLVKPLQKHASHIAMSKIDGIYWLSEGKDQAHEGGLHGDPHLWLDLSNVARLSEVLAQELIRLLPAQQSLIESRQQNFVNDLIALDEQTNSELKPLKGGFISYHQALAYYVSAHQLTHLASILEGSEERPGARHITELKKGMAKEARCLVADLSETESARRYAALLGLPLEVADVLAQNPGISSWFGYYQNFAEVFKRCMNEGQ